MVLLNELDFNEKVTIFGSSLPLHRLIPLTVIIFAIPLSIIYIYSAYLLYSRRNEKELSRLLEHRHKILFSLFFALNGYWCCINLYVLAIIQLLFYPSAQNGLIFQLCWSYVYFWLVLGTTLLAIRVWRLYFFYNFQIVQIKQLWRKHFNSNTKYESWFLKHKQLRNVKWLIKIGIIFVIFSTILMATLAIRTQVGMF